MITTVFILGNHIQALGLARQVNNEGLDAILFTDSKYSITRFSNAIKKTIFFKNNTDLIERITILFNNKKDTLLFPTNDSMVDFLNHNYIQLSDKFYLGIPEPETVQIFSNKRNTYRFAMENNIPIPKSHFPNSLRELKIISETIQYPVIIKPAIMHTFHKAFGIKAIKCNGKDELLKNVERVIQKIPFNQIIIQEYLTGGAKTLYSYGTFAANGKTIASVMANRIRQNPMDFGNSTTYAITCYIPDIEKSAEKILSLTNYFGLAEVEFMYDKNTDQYKFLEINTRAWKWHSISNALGFSFIIKMINYLNKNDRSEIKNFTEIIGWIERLTDSTVVFKELFNGNNLIKETLQSYKIPIEYAVWCKKDILPFVMYLILSPILYLKRH